MRKKSTHTPVRNIGPVKIIGAILLCLFCVLLAVALNFAYFAGRFTWSNNNTEIWNVEYSISFLEKDIKEDKGEAKINRALPIFRERNIKMVSTASITSILKKLDHSFSLYYYIDEREDYIFRLENGTWYTVISYETIAYGNSYKSWAFYELGSWIDALFYRIGTDIGRN